MLSPRSEKHSKEDIVAHIINKLHGSVADVVHTRFDPFEDSDEGADYLNTVDYKNDSQNSNDSKTDGGDKEKHFRLRERGHGSIVSQFLTK